ncbi:MAG: PTS system mannose/fructose/sorbose family transporter subunit IID [Lachnospiraceae bacterium]|nr:PTS system mannose/fructose/sorbose family transporter subunit IID [Lachnospiraceae bacterium]
MQVTTLQIVLIALFYSCVQSFLPFGFICRAANSPLVIGWVIGIILGDPLTGATTGALIQMVYLGVVSVGNTVSSNKVVAATIGVSFVMIQALDAEAGLVLAVPVGVALATMQNWIATLLIVFANMVSKSIYEKKYSMAYVWFFISGFCKMAIYFVAMFIALRFGVSNLTGLVDNIPAWITAGMTVVAGALPAVGLALGLKPLSGRGTVWYTIISFILVSQLELSVMTMCILAVCLSAFIIFGKIERGEVDFSSFFEEGEERSQHVITQKDAVVASLKMNMCNDYIVNSVKYLGETLMLIMLPIMKKLYPDNQDRQVEELSKYDCYFTTAAILSGVITAPVMLMEEQRAQGNEEVTPEVINGYIAGTMGPVAAIGDPLGQAVINVVCISVGLGMVNAGSAWGAGIAFLGMLIGNGIFVLGTPVVAYRFGTRIIDKLFSSGIGTVVSEIGGVIGSVAFGALAASYVKLSFGELAFAGVTLQTDLIDKILPGLLPLCLLLWCYNMLKKNKVSALAMLLIVFVAAFVLGAVGILS